MTPLERLLFCHHMSLSIVFLHSIRSASFFATQPFIGEGAWDDQAILAEHQRLVNETLGEEDGVLIIDGSDFPKHGQHSVGVAPQWCGNTGKKDNCQAGSSWVMSAAKERPCLIGGCTCLNPGLMRTTRCCTKRSVNLDA